MTHRCGQGVGLTLRTSTAPRNQPIHQHDAAGRRTQTTFLVGVLRACLAAMDHSGDRACLRRAIILGALEWDWEGHHPSEFTYRATTVSLHGVPPGRARARHRFGAGPPQPSGWPRRENATACRLASKTHGVSAGRTMVRPALLPTRMGSKLRCPSRSDHTGICVQISLPRGPSGHCLVTHSISVI